MTARLTLHLWCCEDETDGLCYQPTLAIRDPDARPAYRVVWHGTFHNYPTGDEVASMSEEVRAKAREFDIPLVERPGFAPYGERDVREGEQFAEVQEA